MVADSNSGSGARQELAPVAAAPNPGRRALLVPRATYRLQFHRGFTLQDGARLIPYLASLGISHVYASPMLKAAAGSTHGYDVCDWGTLNPELGTEADLGSFVHTLQQHGMALVLDIVPNHVGVGTGENRWWWDVLKHGPASAFASFFDIDWDGPDPPLRGKVLLPVLGDDYEAVRARGELRVVIENDEPRLGYFEHRFPLTPSSWPGVPAGWLAEAERVNAARESLDALIAAQPYQLAHWRDGEGRLNYRRFFDISSLAGVRVEDEKVFRETHARVLDWHRRGWVAGFRVDHPDGLRNPREYFERLRAEAPSAWITVEKILEGQELLPACWPVEGTTGYDFLNLIGGLFIDSAGEKSFTRFYEEYAGRPAEFEPCLRAARREILQHSFPAELNRLARLAEEIAAGSGSTVSGAPAWWGDALRELIACFPVYRTYIEPGEKDQPTARDRAVIDAAVAAAHPALPEDARPALAFVAQILRGEFRRSEKAGEPGTAAEFIARFQQLTGPAMAKGKEDTAFYRHHRFVALNEVGGDPARFGVSPGDFVATCIAQQERWPHRMLATSTHDTKRSEDVRARLSVLSEIPGPWADAVRRWTVINEANRTNAWPDRNVEYAFYQNLVGAWPIATKRLQAFLLKAVREAREQTSWRKPNPAYESAVHRFVRDSLADSAFRKDVEQFVRTLIDPAQVNSLAQTLLKLTAPGVPDLYQGTELWDFSLVDPDNRRPVDFEIRQNLLAQVAALAPDEAWARRRDGTAKLWLIAKTLGLRRRFPAAFSGTASCEAIPAAGRKANHVVAWCRAGRAAAIVPRLVVGLGKNWEDTRIELSPGIWRDELSGENLRGGEVRLEERLRRFPVALLSKQETT